MIETKMKIVHLAFDSFFTVQEHFYKVFDDCAAFVEIRSGCSKGGVQVRFHQYISNALWYAYAALVIPNIFICLA